jgi:hypothetical protein
MFQENAGLGKDGAGLGPLEALEALVLETPKIVDFAERFGPAIK